MTVLVTRATGFIGRHLVRYLLEQGETVRVLTRNPDRVPAAWDGRVDIVVGDLANRATLRAAVQGVGLIRSRLLVVTTLRSK